MTVITIGVSVRDSAGATASTTTTANVSTGGADAPQLPAALSGYAIRPAWLVAGVDFFVGCPSATVLKNPSTAALPTGVSRSGHTLTISGSNVTLDGWDFTQGGGWQVATSGNPTNIIIQNCNWLVGANNLIPIFMESNGGPGAVTIQNNTIDGAMDTRNVNPMIYFGGRSLVCSNNYFKNFANDGIDIILNLVSGVVENNLFWRFNNSAGHTDCLQTYYEGGGNQTIGSLKFRYNTQYQPSNWGGQGNSFIRVGDQGSGIVSKVEVAFNTGLLPPNTAGGNMSKFFDLSGVQQGRLVNPCIHDNYLDQRGALWQYAGSYFYDTPVVNPSQWDNIDLTNNKPIRLGVSGDNKQPGGTGSIPATPTISTASGNPVVLAGTGPNGPISVYINGLPVARVTASGGGWSYTSNVSSGTFTVRAVDSHANASNESNSKVV